MAMHRTLAWIACLVVVLAVTACSSTATTGKAGRVAVSEYRDWTISVAPYSSGERAWRARVDISPKGRSSEAQRRIRLHFTESAATEQAIVEAGTRAARHHIDGLHLPRQ